MNVECTVYRCARQSEMYLYLRAGLSPDDLPEALRRHTGATTAVMNLSLHPQRTLARADVLRVIEQLQQTGYYLQMPPSGAVKAHLHFGD
ncbi:YcgL domain-containing protein [Solimonas marina]|uniref:YcgL domain-containing protein n=1 Tax=Solimonas marina TaxID=2714601 RepID=A0A970B7A7_9GAMM|nr:YcgL domain-containing protein [Solimonas marina]NKF23693.1 YcgL domain-containing protein [Solimonas marina]